MCKLLIAMLLVTAACAQGALDQDHVVGLVDPQESPAAAPEPIQSPAPDESAAGTPPTWPSAAPNQPEEPVSAPSPAASLPRDCPPHEEPPPGHPPDELVERAQRYAESHADTSAGLWIWGDGMRFRFTGDLDDHQRELERIAEGRMTVEVFPARWSERELRALQERITQDGGDYAGARWTAVGVDVFANQVMLMLDRVDEASRAAVAERWPAEQVCLAEGTPEARPGTARPMPSTEPGPRLLPAP